MTCTTNIHINATNAAIKLRISENLYIVQNLCTKVVLKSSYAYNILREYFDTSSALLREKRTSITGYKARFSNVKHFVITAKM